VGSPRGSFWQTLQGVDVSCAAVGCYLACFRELACVQEATDERGGLGKLAAGIEVCDAAAVAFATIVDLDGVRPEASVDRIVQIQYRSLPDAPGAVTFDDDVVDAPAKQSGGHRVAHPYCWTRMQPSCGEQTQWARLRAGPASVLPAFSDATVRCTYDIAYRVCDARADGTVIYPADAASSAAHAAILPAALPIVVIASGDLVERDDAPSGSSSSSSSSSTNGTGVPSDSSRGHYVAATARSLAFRYATPLPISPGGYGFVVGPLQRYSRDAAAAGARPVAAAGLPGASMDVDRGSAVPRDASGTAAGSPHAITGSHRGGGGGELQRAPLAAALLGEHVPDAADLVAVHFASPQQLRTGHLGLHTRRSKHAVAFTARYLRSAYPFKRHRHVFLPSRILASTSSLLATPVPQVWGGLPLSPGPLAPAPGGGEGLHAEVAHDVFPFAGFTLYPEALLLPASLPDPEAHAHRAQALGVAYSWLATRLQPGPGGADPWLYHALAGHLTALYLRQLRGADEYHLALLRATEVRARCRWRCCGTGGGVIDCSSGSARVLLAAFHARVSALSRIHHSRAAVGTSAPGPRAAVSRPPVAPSPAVSHRCRPSRSWRSSTLGCRPSTPAPSTRGTQSSRRTRCGGTTCC